MKSGSVLLGDLCLIKNWSGYCTYRVRNYSRGFPCAAVFRSIPGKFISPERLAKDVYMILHMPLSQAHHPEDKFIWNRLKKRRHGGNPQYTHPIPVPLGVRRCGKMITEEPLLARNSGRNAEREGPFLGVALGPVLVRGARRYAAVLLHPGINDPNER